MSAPTLVQSGFGTAAQSGFISTDFVLSCSVSTPSNVTSGNKLLLFIDAKLFSFTGGWQPSVQTSGSNYNPTINSSWTNIGSATCSDSGLDLVYTHNDSGTSSNSSLTHWAFVYDIPTTGAFSETIDISYLAATNSASIISPNLGVTVQEWSGLDSITAVSNWEEEDTTQVFNVTDTGASYTTSDIVLLAHFSLDDPDDDSTVLVSSGSATKINSGNIVGNNARGEYYYYAPGSTSSLALYYDDNGPTSDSVNFNKSLQTYKLAGASSTTYANTAEIINTAHVQCSRDIEYQSSVTKDHTVILTIYKGNDSTEGDVNGFSGGVWHSKSAYSDDATKTLVNYHYTDANFGGSSAVPQTLYVANNDIIQAPQIDSADCNLALDFSTAGFATPSTGTVTQISDLIDLTAITDITSGKFINQSNTLGDWNALRHNTASGKVGLPAALQTTLSKSTEATIFMMFGSMPASGSVYLFGEHDATNTTGDDPKFYILTNSASQINAQEGTVFATTTGYEDYQVRTLRWEKTSVIERVNGTQVVSTGTVGSNASLTIESLFQVLTDENTFNSATGAELMEIYIVDHAMETNAIEMMEGYFYQKYNLSSQSYSEQAWPTSGHVINESTPFTLYEHTPNSIVSKFVLTGTGDYTNESISGPIIVTIGKSPVGSLSTVTLRFE